MQGFGLVEVLVSLVIIAVGLLGIAKIQALAFAETGTSASRSIAAIQASSMAASMRANRSFWSKVRPGPINPFVFSIVGTTISSNDLTIPAAAACKLGEAQAPCSATNLAVYDVQEWANALNAALGASAGVKGNITCNSTTLPVNCTVFVQWTERIVGASGAAGAIVTPDYTLYVEP